MNKDLPLVSVIMSTYNDGKYLKQAINSILRQTYRNLELIVIDDASTDNTQNILKSITDARFCYFTNQENKKLAHNLNCAIGLSKGDYIARMDADDIAVKTRLERQIKYLENHPEIDVLGCFAQSFGDVHSSMTYPIWHDEIKTELLFNNALCHPTVVFRKKTIDYLYDEDFAASQDYELWSRIIWSKRFHNIPEYLLRYRVHSNQTKKKNANLQKNGGFLARKNMLKHLYDPITEELITGHYKLVDISFDDYIPKTEKEFSSIVKYCNQLTDTGNASKEFDSLYIAKRIKEMLFWQWYSSIGKTDICYSKNLTFFDIAYRKRKFSTKVKAVIKHIKGKMTSEIKIIK